MQNTPPPAQVGASRHEQIEQLLASRMKPYGHAMLQVTPGHATECEPVGHMLHVHVPQPFESTAVPFGPER